MIDIVLDYEEEDRALAEAFAAFGWKAGTQEDWFKTRQYSFDHPASRSPVHAVRSAAAGTGKRRRLPSSMGPTTTPTRLPRLRELDPVMGKQRGP